MLDKVICAISDVISICFPLWPQRILSLRLTTLCFLWRPTHPQAG